MITNEIYFFENQSSVSTSDFLYNVNDGTLILQVDGDVSNLELSVLGNTDLVDDDFVTLKTINASDYSMGDKITSTGIYWIDINGIRKIKLNLSKITGSVSVKAITKRGLTTDLVARAMAANASGGGSYTLPVASASTLGGIKVGENLTITEDGILNATGGGGGGLPVIYIGSDNSNSNPFVIDLDTLQNGTVIVLDKSLNNFFITMKGTNNVQRLPVNDVRVYMFTNVYSTTPTDYSKFEPLRLIQLDSRVTMINPQYTYMTFGFFAFYVSGTVLLYDAYYLYSNDIVTNNKSSEISAVMTFMALPKSGVTPTEADQFTRKGYVDALPTTYSGYDATKTQVLKNINGTLTWVDE